MSRCLLGLAAALFLALAPASAQDFSAADQAAMRAYVLTAAKLTGFVNGTAALAMARDSNPALAKDLEAIEQDDAMSLAQLRAKVTQHPAVFAFYQRQGLTADDVVLIPLVTTY